jgi:hypothetical protein
MPGFAGYLTALKIIDRQERKVAQSECFSRLA